MSVSKRLEWSPRAGRDLLAIEEYYADYSQVTADRVIAEIRRSALQLEIHPQIGRRGQVSGTRELVIGRYRFILVYRIVGRRRPCLRRESSQVIDHARAQPRDVLHRRAHGFALERRKMK